MKQKLFLLWLFTALLGFPLQALADREVLQPQFGKQTITVASDETITFYDWKGTDNISSTTSNNSQSLTVFTPAEEGMSIQITFESCDVKNDGSTWFGKVYVYSGNPDADNSFTWATATNNVGADSTMPEGNILAEMDGTYSNVTYTSLDASGILSVGMLWRYAKACDGWVAKVKAVKLEDMTITGAGSDYEGIGGQLSSRNDVPLANVFVTASGILNPDHLTGICFTMAKNENAMDPSALKLFNGSKQVAATVEAVGNDYKFITDEIITDGTNTYTIKGDFLPTAAVGSKVKVDITKITSTSFADGITPFQTGSSIEVSCPAVVLMSEQDQTITIGETPVSFFDEGGIDGGIFAKTNGQVTFLSGVEGKKVMVNFTKNDIWHGTYYNQELRIYNGTEVKAANLLKTLQQGETAIIRSTSADGALTVVLFSDTQSNIAADGFEAEVSLFTPQPMDFDAVSVSQIKEGTVCAGDTNQSILEINVKAVNTEPAMQVEKMAFTTNNTYSILTKASLLFNGKKVGESSITADAFDITLTEPASLVEGDNLFTLAYDISEEAINDQTIDATLVSVTAKVNNASKTETVAEGNPEGSRVVYNIVLSHSEQGTVTKTVNGSLAFETKTAASYSTSCEGGTDDRINIFVPKHEGMVCQIDFSEFDLAYATTAYGIKSVFKIFAGEGTSGELLWELNSEELKDKGPGKTIRSNASNGALTVLFNPNNSSYYKKGFKSVVSEYLPKNMTVATADAEHATTAIVSVGSSNQELLNINVKTDGDLNPLKLNGMRFSLKGTEANISKITLWQGETMIGEAASAAEAYINLAEAITLEEGNNQFVLKADIKEDATADQIVDAALLSVNADNNEIAATSGDPEGSRTIKNIIVIANGDNGEVKLSLGQKFTLYDDGGPDGDGADGVEATITFAPTTDGHVIKLTDKGLSLNYTSRIYIYRGGEAIDDSLIVDLSGSSAKFDPIISEIDNPKLTIKYVGKGTYTKPNFTIEAEGYLKQPIAITGVTSEDISVNEVLKGQTDVRMLKVAVDTKGDLGCVEITGFNVSCTNSEAISAQHIYQTGTVNAFSANETFSEKYTINKEGTYYFWIAYDIKPESEVGQTADATVSSIIADGNTINIDNPATASVTVASGKSGTYTVGADANYSTIQGAIDDIGTLGMDGPVVLKIKAGEYNERVRIPYIKGMGGVNTLTLESESGERDVKIYHNNYTSGGYSDDQHSKVYGVVTLYEASYVTLKNLEITTTDLSYDAVVMIKNESRHATIDNCYLHTATSSKIQQDINLIGHYVQNEENKNNDYLTVRNCLLEGGYIGINMGGTGYVRLPKEVGGVIEGNTLRNQGSKAIYVMDELGAKIRNNTIIITADAEVNMATGIFDTQLRDEYSESMEITGNVFNVAPNKYTAAIHLRQMTGTEAAPVIIANNVVNMTSQNSSYSVLKLSSAEVSHTNIANNTFRMTGSNGGAAFWVSSKLDGENVNVVNNIIQNETSGYAVNLYNDENLDKIAFKNNMMFTEGETFYRASSETIGDFASFVEKTNATGCINKKVEFLSDDILEPSGDLDGDLLTAVSLPYVSTDISGKNRPAENITIGAYEYDPYAMNAPVMLEDYPKVIKALDGKAMVAVKTDLAATVYCIAMKAGDGAPDLEELRDSELKKNVAANAETIIDIDNLEDEQEYIAYFLPISLRGVDGVMCQTSPFLMAVTPPETAAPEAMVFINNSNDEETVEAGESVSLMAMVTVDERTSPYTLTWMDSKHTVLKTETFEQMPDEIFTVNVTPTECTDYIFMVTDAAAKADTATVRAIVRGEAVTATFENLYLEPESYENGKNLNGSFVNGSYKFDSFYSASWNFWGNFGYANSTSTSFSAFQTDQFNNAVGGGVDDSENYLVAYPQGGKIYVMNNEEGDMLRGFYITNTAWVVNSVLNGDGMSDAFETGDYLKLTVTADNGESLDYYLADYRDADEDNHYYVDTWQWVDLRQLGTVKTLSFTFDGTKKNNYGLTTPTYFCMDNLNGYRTETDYQIDTESSVVSIAEAFQLEPAGSIVYAFADILADELKNIVSLDGDNLKIDTEDAIEFDVVVSATQRGKTQFVKLHINKTIVSGIDGMSADSDVDARYTIDGKVINGNSSAKGIQIIRKKDGTTVKVVRK